MASSQLLWGKYIRYDRDGEVALLDPVTLDSVYLDRGEVTDLSAVPPTATHTALAELGFSPDGPDRDQREALRNRLRRLGLEPLPVRISGLRVVLTDACNMKCSYCFVDTNTGKPDMTEQELADGLTYLFEANAGQDDVAIQWFGGEPTTRFDLMQRGDERADALAEQYGVQRVRRTVVTNGARITAAMIDHFSRYRYGVGISIDGPPSVNSEHRRLLGGQSADDRIRRTSANSSTRTASTWAATSPPRPRTSGAWPRPSNGSSTSSA